MVNNYQCKFREYGWDVIYFNECEVNEATIEERLGGDYNR